MLIDARSAPNRSSASRDTTRMTELTSCAALIRVDRSASFCNWSARSLVASSASLPLGDVARRADDRLDGSVGGQDRGEDVLEDPAAPRAVKGVSSLTRLLVAITCWIWPVEAGGQFGRVVEVEEGLADRFVRVFAQRASSTLLA